MGRGMQCTLVNVYYGPQQYMYDYYISFRERHYESLQWHWFEYFSVHYRQKGDKHQTRLHSPHLLGQLCSTRH